MVHGLEKVGDLEGAAVLSGRFDHSRRAGSVVAGPTACIDRQSGFTKRTGEVGVVGELGDVDRSNAFPLGEKPRNVTMHADPAGRRDGVVSSSAEQGVHEGPSNLRTRNGNDKACSLSPLQNLEQLVDPLSYDCGQYPHVELGSEYGRQVQHCVIPGSEAARPRGQEPLQCDCTCQAMRGGECL
jgi:hypothetical protein